MGPGKENGKKENEGIIGEAERERKGRQGGRGKKE